MVSGLYTVGGSSTVIDNLAINLAKKGIDVTIGALKFDKNPPKGIHSTNMLNVNSFLKLRQFLGNFDIVHSHHAITNYLALVNKRHFVYHYHGSPDFGKRSLFGFNVFFSIKTMHYAFDAIIAVSETGCAELKQSFGLKNVCVIYNGVDTERFNPSIKQKFRKGMPQLLFVGNLYEHKNIHELIFAVKDLIKIYPKTYLQIIGEGREYPRLKSLVERLNLGSNVELVGRVSDDELPYYYASCDVYTTASRWELFGLPLLEAMACGKPIVASSIQSHKELLSKSGAGTTYVLEDQPDLQHKLIRTYEESDKYTDNALKFAKGHDWAAVTNQLIEIYASLLER